MMTSLWNGSGHVYYLYSSCRGQKVYIAADP